MDTKTKRGVAMIKVRDVGQLKAEVLRARYNYADFARCIGISRSALNNVFKRQRISAPMAKKVCDELHKDFDIFFALDVSN